MATQVKFRRDTRSNLLLSVPVEGEIGVDTTNDRTIVGDGSTSGGIPQASYKDVQNNSFNAGTVTGTADALVLTLDDAPTAYAQYQSFWITPASNNTTAATININSLGAKDIEKDDGTGTLTALDADDLKAGIPVEIVYNGTKFIVQLGGGGGAVSGDWVFINSYTDTSGLNNALDITDALDSTYDVYWFEIVRARPNFDDRMYVRLSDDTGSTFETTLYSASGAGNAFVFDNTIIESTNNTGYLGALGDLYLYYTQSTSKPKVLKWNYIEPNNGNNTFTHRTGADVYWGKLPINAIRFYCANAAAEWADIEINVYGRVLYV